MDGIPPIVDADASARSLSSNVIPKGIVLSRNVMFTSNSIYILFANLAMGLSSQLITTACKLASPLGGTQILFLPFLRKSAISLHCEWSLNPILPLTYISKRNTIC